MEEIKSRAASWSLEFLVENPEHTDRVNELYSLMISEIEEGGSPENEFELFIESVEQLLEKE